jgi:small subunit ribosomal protein S3Ae
MVPAATQESLVNRVISIPLKEITRDISHIYTTIRLRVSEVQGKTAITKFIGHSLAREYIGTLVRRRRDALEVVLPAVSKDGLEFQIKALVVTAYPCSDKQKRAVRSLLVKLLKEKASAADLGQFERDALFGKLAAELQNALHKIVPVRRVEILKTELVEEFDVQETVELEAQKKEAPAEEEPKEKTEEEAAATA